MKSGKTYKVYGDILVPVESDLHPQSVSEGSLWAQGTLYYTFDVSVAEADRTTFKQWVAQWEIGSGLRIVEDPAATNRVLVQRAKDIGCGWSSVGMLGGEQDLVIKVSVRSADPS